MAVTLDTSCNTDSMASHPEGCRIPVNDQWEMLRPLWKTGEQGRDSSRLTKLTRRASCQGSCQLPSRDSDKSTGTYVGLGIEPSKVKIPNPVSSTIP